MPSNKTIKFNVTNDQFTRIKRNAEIKGFNTTSSYLRNLALNKDQRFEEMFIEVYKIIKNGK